MRGSSLIRGILITMMWGYLIAFILLGVIGWLPVYFDNGTLINEAGLQRAYVEQIANYAQILQTPQQQVPPTVAVAILQTTLPAWEQEEGTIAQSNDPQVIYFSVSASLPFLHIDQAARTILNEYQRTGKVDETQVAIILQYERSYYASVNDLVFYLQNQTQERDIRIAGLQTFLLVVLAINIGIAFFLARKRHMLEALEKGS